MNAAKILIKKYELANCEIIALQGDYINTSNLTSLDPGLYERQASQCKLLLVNIKDGKITFKSSGLSKNKDVENSVFDLIMGSPVNLTDNSDQTSFEISLVSTKVEGKFTGPGF